MSKSNKIGLLTYIGGGFIKLNTLTVSDISRVELNPQEKQILIICAGEKLTFPLHPDIIKTLKEANCLHPDFEISELEMNKAQLRERLIKLEKSSK